MLLEGIGPRLARLFIHWPAKRLKKIFQKTNLEPRPSGGPRSSLLSSILDVIGEERGQARPAAAKKTTAPQFLLSAGVPVRSPVA